MSKSIMCTVADAYLAESSGGTPSIKVVCTPDAPDAEIGDRIYGDLWLSDKAIQRTIDRIKEVWGHDVTDFGTACEAIKGRPVLLVMEQEEYNGQLKWKVKFFNNPERKPRQVDGNLLADLNAKLRSMGIRPAPAGAKPAPQRGIDVDKDLPY